MQLPEVLYRKSVTNARSTLFIQLEKSDNDETTTGISNITYESAWKIACLHSKWINGILGQHLQKEDFQNLGSASRVVVAFLSDNCPDLLLSLIGCLMVDVSIYNNIQVIPALLNYRWTAHDIVNALSLDSSDEKKKF